MIVIVIILSLFAVSSLFQTGFFNMHDFQQVIRLFQMDKAISAGQFPVRWVADLGFGYGYNLFNFYPPIVYYFGEVFHKLGFSFIDATKIVWGAALIGSAVSMYFFAGKLFGKIGGLVSATFYLYTPYHAVDAYVRGALAELFSFVWLPLILLFANKPLISGIFLALLMITHNLIFLPFVGFYVLWSRNPKNIFFSLLTAFGLTAFFWMPSLWEKQFTMVDQFLTTGLANYQIHFVCPNQLWNSLWGYGGSVAGCLDGISFKLGKPQIILALVALIFGIWKKSRLLFGIFALFALSVFMTTDFSKFIWDRVSLLWYLQFPWRFLEFAALFSALLAGSLFLIIKKKYYQIVVAAILIFLVIFLHAKYFVPQRFENVTDATLLSDYQVKWVVSQTSFEYMPKGIAVKTTLQGSYILDIKNFPMEKFLVITGDFTASEAKFNGDRFLLNGRSVSGAKIEFQITNFPGWKVWVDGNEASIDDNNKLKLITVNVPAGEHQITGKFTNTPVRVLGNTISIFSIIMVMFIYLYGRKRNKT